MVYLIQGPGHGGLTKTVRDSSPIRSLPWCLAALILAGCGWISADGPWNEPSSPTPAQGTVSLTVSVLVPDGGRPVAGASIEVTDDADTLVAEGVTDAYGEALLPEVPIGRHTLAARIGHLAGWRVIDFAAGLEGQVMEPLRLEAGDPVVLDVRDAEARLWDPVARRLEELGLTSVREGPESAAAAGALFALPAGLYEYGLVLIGGDLDYPALLDDDQAMSGLWDHLQAGGGLYLSGPAWPLLLALAPGAVELSDGVSDFGYTEARVVSPELAEQLGWSRVGVPMSAGLPVLTGAGAGASVLLSGEVETTSGEVLDGPMLVEVPVGEGTVVYATFTAPEPRADEWWLGDPAAWELPDGSWEGRGAAIDRALLAL